jgi:hypothetical protein
MGFLWITFSMDGRGRKQGSLNIGNFKAFTGE